MTREELSNKLPDKLRYMFPMDSAGLGWRPREREKFIDNLVHQIDEGVVTADEALSAVWESAKSDQSQPVTYVGKMTLGDFYNSIPDGIKSIDIIKLWKSIEDGDNSAEEVLYEVWHERALFTKPKPIEVDRTSDEYWDSDEYWESVYLHQKYVENVENHEGKKSWIKSILRLFRII